MSKENVDLVRSIFEPGERGDFGDARWADREIEYTIVDGRAGQLQGTRGISRGYANLAAMGAVRDPCRPIPRAGQPTGSCADVRPRARQSSGMALEALSSVGAQLVHIRDGKVTGVDVYYDRHRALADLGLEE